MNKINCFIEQIDKSKEIVCKSLNKEECSRQMPNY